MIFTPLRVLPALAMLLAGCVAVDAWRKQVRARDAKREAAHRLQTWEGEGGNPPPDTSHAGDETSLATSAP